ncbi:Cas10/Cmr2 second palm domain-containing protein [Streptomyces sp. NPDC020845]|uniref:Cas10/Cmr2 second palm domain-containing protein n=1 Tax=Streptomyces sp. NPDC020845 TaxID=3365096 RepID=UPI003797CC26
MNGNTLAVEQVYIDVGFLRIQRYLARTTKLRGRRSASAGMAEATKSEAIAARLPDGLALANEEAGVADGVVNLRLGDPRPEGQEERVEQVITAVLAELRTEFPAAELQAVWGIGESYVSAYVQQIGPRTHRGEVRHDLPVLPEFPATRLCPLCRTDPATESARLPEAPGKPQMVCADCARRLHRRGGRAGISAEQRLQAALELSDAPDMLEDLAPLGAGDTKRNHLATIHIDGNAVGLFFKRLVAAASDRAELRDVKRDLSKKLSDLAECALQYGTLAVVESMGAEDTGRLPVVPHVLGGDDVLVSVPASYAWAFTVTYLRVFDEEMRDLVTPINERHRLDLPVPSASAGMVFARHSEPMYLLVDLAEERLRAAKQGTGGRASSLDFLDLTADGLQGAGDPPLPLSVIAAPETRRALDGLAALGQSHRARLAEALRDHADDVSARGQAQRLGTFKAVEPFLTGPDGRAPRCGITLRHALRITSWWRTGTVLAGSGW